MNNKVTKWACHVGNFDDKVTTVKAVLVETDKMFRLDSKDNEGKVSREFRAAAGYQRQWHKEKGRDMQFLHNTEDQAISWLVGCREKEVEEAARVLKARKYYLQLICEQVDECEWRTIK